MSSPEATLQSHFPSTHPPRAAGSALDRVARAALERSLDSLQSGRVVLAEAGRERGHGPAGSSLAARIEVRSPRFYRRALLGSVVGAAESWIDGEWECDDLTALVRILARERAVLESMDGGLARLAEVGRRLFHRRNRNTRSGSRRNIAAHYDLGNDFFALFLDPTLTYSSGIFERADASMEEASVAKYERLCRSLELGPEHHLLEIGTGWGGFAMHAARHHGCRVTTTTISKEQHDLARQRIVEAGLEDRVELLLEDYRDLRGRYDRVVSIEMIEAVGHQYMDTFFSKCASLLREDGLMALQCITIRDQHYERALAEVDFIKRYVFPGGFLPSVTALAESATRASDLGMVELADYTPHYAETLRRWRDRFHANREAIAAAGYDEAFLRLWDFYLSYCEGGFEERHIGLVQLLLARPGARPVQLPGPQQG